MFNNNSFREDKGCCDDNPNVDSFPQNIKSIIATLCIVIDQIGSGFEQARELILEIARQLDEGKLCARNEISRTIKKILKDKIQAGKITEKWIEECLAPEYKRQYNKSEPSSLSKEQPKQHIIEVSTKGAQVSPEQQADNNVIDQFTEGQASNKMESANKLEQNVIPTAAGGLEAVKENNDTTIDSVLTIDGEYSSILPALSDLEYRSLKTSIQEHGQPFPIVVNQDGVILDGHHRYKACHELGIKPSVLVKQFENRLQEKKFIIDRSRRHLNEFQRCELQIKLESIESEIAKERMSNTGEIGAEK